MQFSGDPTFTQGSLLPYDLAGFTNCVDIWEPEAYGRIGNWNSVKPGLFTAAYARFLDKNKPVMWAEIGYDTWDNATHAPLPSKQQFQAQYFRDFYRMLVASQASGVFFWWYPGGFRMFENSDYGVINPDGTYREASHVTQEQSKVFLSSPGYTSPSQPVPIAINPDDPRGLPGIYESVKSNYWHAIEQNQTPILQ
jgi:hypothetical protein